MVNVKESRVKWAMEQLEHFTGVLAEISKDLKDKKMTPFQASLALEKRKEDFEKIIAILGSQSP